MTGTATSVVDDGYAALSGARAASTRLRRSGGRLGYASADGGVRRRVVRCVDGNDIRRPAGDLDRERDHADGARPAHAALLRASRPGASTGRVLEIHLFGRAGDISRTWHTHPEPVPTPSGMDRDDWAACLRENPRRPLAFVLVGTDQVRVFVRERRQFRPLIEECANHG